MISKEEKGKAVKEVSPQKKQHTEMDAKGSSTKLLKNRLLQRIGEKKEKLPTSNTEICKYLYIIIYIKQKKLNISDQSHLRLFQIK